MPKKICPICNGKNVAFILYGYFAPTKEITKGLDENKMVVGGCLVSEISPKWKCTDCSRSWGKLI